jgi:hypothetical protein
LTRGALPSELDAPISQALNMFERIDPDALVHFGTCATAVEWARAVTNSEWNPAKITNGAFYATVNPNARPLLHSFSSTATEHFAALSTVCSSMEYLDVPSKPQRT